MLSSSAKGRWEDKDLPVEDRVDAESIGSTGSFTLNNDDKELEALGYKPSFKREFSNLATVRRMMVKTVYETLND